MQHAVLITRPTDEMRSKRPIWPTYSEGNIKKETKQNDVCLSLTNHRLFNAHTLTHTRMHTRACTQIHTHYTCARTYEHTRTHAHTLKKRSTITRPTDEMRSRGLAYMLREKHKGRKKTKLSLFIPNKSTFV